MNFRFAACWIVSATIFACVGSDDNVNTPDGGNDATSDGTLPGDAALDTSSDAPADVEADAPRPVPTPVGDFDWAGVEAGTSYGPIAYDAQGNLFQAFQYYTSTTVGGQTFNTVGGYDMVLVKWDPTGKVIWARPYGGTGSDQLTAIAVDPAGDAYALFLSSSPTIAFGNGVTFTKQGTNYDGFLVKLKGSNGDGVWLANYTKSNENYLACSQIAYGGGKLAIECSAYQGLVLTKDSDSSTITMSCLECGGANPQYDNMYIASLNPANGHAYWTNQISANAQTSATGLAVDSTGAVGIAFSSFGAIVHDPTNTINWTYQGVAGSIALVAKLASTNGAGVWFKQFTDGTTNNNNQTEPGGVAFMSSGDVVLGGQIYGTVPFGTKSLKSGGGSDVFITRLKGAFGDVVWARTFGGTANDSVAQVGVDPWDEIFAAGDYLSIDAKLDAFSFPGASKGGGYVGKLDPNGNGLWATGLVSSSTSVGLGPYNALAVDPSVGDVTVTGEFQGTVDLGDGNPQTSPNGEEDIFVVTHKP